MSAVFLTTDLMFSSRVAAAARQQDVALATVSSADQLQQRVAGGGVKLAILDLSGGGFDVADLVSRLRQNGGESTNVVAFAPHVHEAKLAAAVQAGCDDVLSRGQFDRQLDEIIGRG